MGARWAKSKQGPIRGVFARCCLPAFSHGAWAVEPSTVAVVMLRISFSFSISLSLSLSATVCEAKELLMLTYCCLIFYFFSLDLPRDFEIQTTSSSLIRDRSFFLVWNRPKLVQSGLFCSVKHFFLI